MPPVSRADRRALRARPNSTPPHPRPLRRLCRPVRHLAPIRAAGRRRAHRGWRPQRSGRTRPMPDICSSIPPLLPHCKSWLREIDLELNGLHRGLDLKLALAAGGPDRDGVGAVRYSAPKGCFAGTLSIDEHFRGLARGDVERGSRNKVDRRRFGWTYFDGACFVVANLAILKPQAVFARRQHGTPAIVDGKRLTCVADADVERCENGDKPCHRSGSIRR